MPTHHYPRILMVRAFILVLVLILFPAADLLSQRLSGTVSDGEGHPLSDATIVLPALQRWTSTDKDGTFSFSNITFGHYILEASLVGYSKESRDLNFKDESALAIVMTPSPVELPVVTVTAESQPAVLREVTLPTTVLDSHTLRHGRGSSLGETIELQPGVSGFSGGSFAVKPVIHGLTGQRVLVLTNGRRMESQTWDEPQSPELDILDLDQVEIVRGAASVLYGSDALGGVVNAVSKRIPSNPGTPLMEGMATINAFSNNPQGAGSLSLSGLAGGWGYRANFTTRFADDYTTPSGKTADGQRVKAGSVFNSGIEEFNGSLAASTSGEWGSLYFDAAHFGQNYEIAPEPGRKEYELNISTGVYDSLPAAPHQEIFHERLTAGTIIPASLGRFEVSATLQRNLRKEEGVKETEEDEQKKESMGIKPEVELVLSSLTLEGRLHHAPVGGLYGTIGASAILQSNETEGQKAIIPGFSALTLGGFLYEVYQPEHGPRFTAGVRYDARNMDVDANASLGTVAQTTNFQSFTATGGVAWTIPGDLTIAINAGRAWRAPVAAELFFHGADEGAVRYKVGSAGLKPEESLDLEGSVRYASPALQSEITVFRNSINRYIFLTPAGYQINSLDVYRYVQADATLTGGEIVVRALPFSWLIVDAGLDFVRGTNDNTKSPLPLVPADRMILGVHIIGEEFWGIRSPAFQVKGYNHARQNRTGPFEVATPGYALIDLGVSGDLTIVGHSVMADLGIRNVFDKAYFDHLSRYKMFALNPGRSITMKLSMLFGILD